MVRNAMIINRYIPFLKQNSIELSPVSVVCMGEVSNGFDGLLLPYLFAMPEQSMRRLSVISRRLHISCGKVLMAAARSRKQRKATKKILKARMSSIRWSLVR